MSLCCVFYCLFASGAIWKPFGRVLSLQVLAKTCAVLVLKRGKIMHSDGIQLPNDGEIKVLREGEVRVR